MGTYLFCIPGTVRKTIYKLMIVRKKVRSSYLVPGVHENGYRYIDTIWLVHGTRYRCIPVVLVSSHSDTVTDDENIQLDNDIKRMKFLPHFIKVIIFTNDMPGKRNSCYRTM